MTTSPAGVPAEAEREAGQIAWELEQWAIYLRPNFALVESVLQEAAARLRVETARADDATTACRKITDDWHQVSLELGEAEARVVELERAIAHVLKHGEVGKQSRARLRAVLAVVGDTE